MTMSGGCLCGGLRFEADGPIRMRGLCLCSTCQKVSGGAGNLFIGLEAEGFRYTRGEPQLFQASDPGGGPIREFCAECGVHIAARSHKAPGGIIVKIGALDEPALFEAPEFVVWTEEKHAFHTLPEGVASFARMPAR